MRGLTFVASNFSIYIRQFVITGTLEGAPYTKAWNGSLWTLTYEALCYVIVGVAVSAFRSRRRSLIFLAVVLLAEESLNVALVAQSGGGQIVGGKGGAVQLIPVFAAGGLFYLLRDRIPASPWIALAAGTATVAAVFLHAFPIIGPIPITYLMMWLGARLPLSGIGKTWDLSYGMYVYAFPIQQILWLCGLSAFPILCFALVSIILTLPIALLSWLALEQPLMGLKRLTARSYPDAEGHVGPVVRAD